MSSKYRRSTRTKTADPPIAANEVRITAQGNRNGYITYALTKLDEHREIVIKAMGRALSQAVTVAEIVKRRVCDLHQITHISASELADTWEPLEEGLKTVVTVRKVPSIEIRLSKDALNTSDPGYQPPLPVELVKQTKKHEQKENKQESSTSENERQTQARHSNSRGRLRGVSHRGASRGGSRSFASSQGENKTNENQKGEGNTRGRGRGRGRGGQSQGAA
jgi:ribonuclease P/MRP protein subunit RPP25